ncbi:glycerol-3-phosphate acyltransferase [candidate division TA06 bacterium]|uniref:Glycerol-3-phosphate acyltransferase n=1 Tax=candidate division TA06 bacterium TaxID=2250710 RepID=A0A523UT13_UNCT6|nr:MAG: glycerol-3-phosphate acyltransferase [candidate division TA06 bacterium]
MELLGWQKIVVGAFVGYLLGSVPFAVVFSRLLKNVDIRRVGTKNPGAANVFREVGATPGLLTWLFDTGKGVAAMIVSERWLGLSGYWVALVGSAAVVGHCWSIFLLFKGGKGLATSGAVLLYLTPKLFLIAIALHFYIQKVAPRSLAVLITAMVFFVGLVYIVYPQNWLTLLAGIVTLIGVGALANTEAMREMRELRRKAKELEEASY